MKKSTDLFSSAIADAKRVVEVAALNAKQQLEENMTPKLQSMFRSRVNENYDELEESDSSDDINIDEILSELEEDDSYLYEAEDDDEKPAKKDDKPAAKKTDSKSSESKEDKVSSLTVSELQDIIRDVITAEMGAQDGLGDDELGDDSEFDDVDMDMGDDGMDMGGAPDGGGDFNFDDDSLGDDDEEIDIDELLAEIDDEDGYVNEAKKKAMLKAKIKAKKPAAKSEKDQLKEARRIIAIQKYKMNEAATINAKISSLNKLFKSNPTLTEGQKFKIVNHLDSANDVKTVNMIFESLKARIAKTPIKRKPIRESLGFASKPAGLIQKTNPSNGVLDTNTMNRWKKLANIK
jgi:hypothetical protein